MQIDTVMSRRNILKAGLLAAGGSCLPLGLGRASDAQEKSLYGPFKVGIQSYSLRGFDAKTALQHTRKLGLQYWEAYPAHVPLGTLPAHIAEQRKMLSDAGVTLLAYGVVGFDANETKAREYFDFAKAMGLVSLSANPKKDKATFDLLDKLVDEYNVAIAIHNHGPGALYDKVGDVEEMVRDRHPLIGACVDTGHYLRSDENPTEVIQKLGNRVHGVHLKDVRSIRDPKEVAKLEKEIDPRRLKQFQKESKIFTILGEGDLDVVGCLKALKELDYSKSVSIEYEENPDNPLSDIEVSLNHLRKCVATVTT